MKKHYLTLIFSALFISACGSSGGSSGDGGSNNKSSDPSITSPNQPSERVNTKLVGSGDNYLSNVNIAYLSPNPVKFNDPNKLSQITIEGKTFDLVKVSRDGVNSSGWLRVIGGNVVTGQDRLPDNVRKVSVYSSDNLVVGLLSSDISKWHEYAFINGKYTDVNDMPKGRASYSVNVPMFSHTKNTVSDYSRRAKLDVDFDAKILSGSIKTVSLSDQPGSEDTINLNAKIDGSHFSSEENTPVTVKGGFFGPNANEIGGMFRTEDTDKYGTRKHMGVFAGKKD